MSGHGTESSAPSLSDEEIRHDLLACKHNSKPPHSTAPEPPPTAPPAGSDMKGIPCPFQSQHSCSTYFLCFQDYL